MLDGWDGVQYMMEMVGFVVGILAAWSFDDMLFDDFSHYL